MEAMEVLHQIVAADREARQRLADARQESESFDRRLETLERELAESAMERAEKDVAAARDASRAASEAALSALDQERATAVEFMKRRFAERKDEGVEKLFRAVIGLDD